MSWVRGGHLKKGQKRFLWGTITRKESLRNAGSRDNVRGGIREDKQSSNALCYKPKRRSNSWGTKGGFERSISEIFDTNINMMLRKYLLEAKYCS